MSTMNTTTALFDAPATETVSSKPRKGFFARLLESRERQAAARVQTRLTRMSDLQLGDLGFSKAQIEKLRATGRIPADFWL